eukprot:1391349-Prymnesium_polylepis.1
MRTLSPTPTRAMVGLAEARGRRARRTWSMKRMQGAAPRAAPKRAPSRASDSPTSDESSCGACTSTKLARAADATARASVVLPQPGGPWRRTPRGGDAPS